MEPTAQAVSQPRQSLSNLLILPPLLFLVILFGMGGYYLGLRQGTKIQQPPQPQPEEKPTAKAITEEELPIGLSLLKNPMIFQWRGEVKGKLVAKDESSITIEDEKGNWITIPLLVLPSGEKLQFLVISGADLAPSPTRLAALEEIPLNADIQSEFVIRQDDKNAIEGFSLIYFESGRK